MEGAASASVAASPGRRHLGRPGATELLTGLVVVAVAATCWWALAPPRIGGKTSFAVVDGTSMLPRMRRGDLVLVRASDRYTVGEVVAYQSALLRRVVLHRIVRIKRGHYTFKGDNNSWLDPETPTAAAIVGKRWIQLPKAGLVTSVLRRPLVAALLMVVLVLGCGLGGTRKPTSE